MAGLGGTLVLCTLAAEAQAGTYYVYSCSSYGNAAPAFTALTGGTNWELPNDCSVGRSLEINQFTTRRRNGKASAWVAYSPSAAIGIVGAYTPVNTVLVDCTSRSGRVYAAYAWSSGSQRISYINGCGSDGMGFGDGISTGFAPSELFRLGGNVQELEWLHKLGLWRAGSSAFRAFVSPLRRTLRRL